MLMVQVTIQITLFVQLLQLPQYYLRRRWLEGEMGSTRTTVHTGEYLDRKDIMILSMLSAQRPVFLV